MTVQTIADHTSSSSIIVSGEKDVIELYTESYVTNGNDFLAADLVTQEGETAPDVDVRSGAEAGVGILLGYASETDMKANYSLGVTIADGKLVKVLRPTGGRVEVVMILHRESTVTGEIEIGEPLYSSTTGDGEVSSAKSLAVGTTHLANMQFVGLSADNVAATVTDNALINVWF